MQIHRIGDRSLIDTVLGSDFQRNIDRYDRTQLGNEKGALAWKGELKIESVLNADVTTAFPIDQAIGDLKPGVYVMTAEPEGAAPRRGLRPARDAMVHRLRSRPDRLLGQ